MRQTRASRSHHTREREGADVLQLYLAPNRQQPERCLPLGNGLRRYRARRRPVQTCGTRREWRRSSGKERLAAATAERCESRSDSPVGGTRLRIGQSNLRAEGRVYITAALGTLLRRVSKRHPRDDALPGVCRYDRLDTQRPRVRVIRLPRAVALLGSAHHLSTESKASQGRRALFTRSQWFSWLAASGARTRTSPVGWRAVVRPQRPALGIL